MLTRTLRFAIAAALVFSAAAPTAAKAEPPHEKLHKLLFGGRDHDRDNGKKKRKHKYDRHDRDRRHYEHECYDHNHNGYCDICSTRLTVIHSAPVIRIQPRVRYESYPAYDSYDRRPIEVDVQIALRREGYYRGPIDGAIGAGSRRAIRDYQYDRGLPVTGRIDGYLLRSLGLR